MFEYTKDFPNLSSERLLLRKLCAEDTAFIYKQFSDPQVSEYLMDAPPLTDMDGAQAIVNFFTNPESRSNNRWVLLRKSDQKPIGTIGFHKWDRDHCHAEIGYDLIPDCWGQGYMTEATKEVVRFGFENMELNRIDAFVYVGNPRSLRVLEKMGFKQEGVLREYFHLNDTFYDHVFLGLLKRDWQG